MEAAIRRLIERHAEITNQALAGHEPDLEGEAALFAAEFIGASPRGVAAGRNDDSLRQAMAAGFARYRETGCQQMRIRDVIVIPIDAHHAMAKVFWRARYRRQDGREVQLDFDVTYFVQQIAEAPKIFGWVSGDEEALLRRHGLA